MTSIEFTTVGVLGFGTMGAGIAQVIAASGRDVVVLEVDQDRIDAGIARITSSLDRAVAREQTTEEQKAATLARLRSVTAVGELASVDLVVESVAEDLAVKQALLAEAVGVVGADVPIVSNTSALSITELAASVPNRQRVAGLHFFNPVPAMRIVEVVRGIDTDDEVVDALVALVDTLDGKESVVVEDRPGFLINALLLPYLNDVITEFDAELATAEDLDVALKLGLGYKTGPMEMLDMIGLDVHLAATQAIYDETGDARYAPPPLLRKMVSAGRLGRKSGRGFRTSEH